MNGALGAKIPPPLSCSAVLQTGAPDEPAFGSLGWLTGSRAGGPRPHIFNDHRPSLPFPILFAFFANRVGPRKTESPREKNSRRPHPNGGTQSVTWVRGTASDTVEVEVKGNFYRNDCVYFAE